MGDICISSPSETGPFFSTFRSLSNYQLLGYTHRVVPDNFLDRSLGLKTGYRTVALSSLSGGIHKTIRSGERVWKTKRCFVRLFAHLKVCIVYHIEHGNKRDTIDDDIPSPLALRVSSVVIIQSLINNSYVPPMVGLDSGSCHPHHALTLTTSFSGSLHSGEDPSSGFEWGHSRAEPPCDLPD